MKMKLDESQFWLKAYTSQVNISSAKVSKICSRLMVLKYTECSRVCGFKPVAWCTLLLQLCGIELRLFWVLYLLWAFELKQIEYFELPVYGPLGIHMLLRWLNHIKSNIHVHITSIIDFYASLHHLLTNRNNIDISLLVFTRIADS